jgi:hypothetical protein
MGVADKDVEIVLRKERHDFGATDGSILKFPAGHMSIQRNAWGLLWSASVRPPAPIGTDHRLLSRWPAMLVHSAPAAGGQSIGIEPVSKPPTFG